MSEMPTYFSGPETVPGFQVLSPNSGQYERFLYYIGTGHSTSQCDYTIKGWSQKLSVVTTGNK